MSYGQTRGHWAIALVLAAVVLTGGTAWAVDGQIDIYPTGATPYVISSPGSYVLVTDVNMTADVDCIQIAASNVTLDLNGHTLTGTGTGNSSGVMQTTGVGALVFNGSIYNFGRHGIFLNERSQVSDLSVLNCGDDGGLYYHAIRVGEGSIISRVTAANNYGNGIDAASNCLVESCVARNNGTVSHKGIAVGSGSTVKDCIAGNNGHRSSQDS
ncbi:MAG TPA: hypothetical protein PKH07_15215, partial [bacterium]|nr:hypothetical protein [bacterium]